MQKLLGHQSMTWLHGSRYEPEMQIISNIPTSSFHILIPKYNISVNLLTIDWLWSSCGKGKVKSCLPRDDDLMRPPTGFSSVLLYVEWAVELQNWIENWPKIQSRTNTHQCELWSKKLTHLTWVFGYWQRHLRPSFKSWCQVRIYYPATGMLLFRVT